MQPDFGRRDTAGGVQVMNAQDGEVSSTCSQIHGSLERDDTALLQGLGFPPWGMAKGQTRRSGRRTAPWSGCHQAYW